MKYCFFIFSLSLLSLNSCGITTGAGGLISSISSYNSCSEDEECTRVWNGCCTCADSGAWVSINSSSYEDFISELYSSYNCDILSKQCQPERPACMAEQGVPVCKEGRCELRNPNERPDDSLLL